MRAPLKALEVGERELPRRGGELLVGEARRLEREAAVVRGELRRLPGAQVAQQLDELVRLAIEGALFERHGAQRPVPAHTRGRARAHKMSDGQRDATE